jgi:hypothetical protein
MIFTCGGNGSLPREEKEMLYQEAYETALERNVQERAAEWITQGIKARADFAEKITLRDREGDRWFDTLGPVGYELYWNRTPVVEETWEYAGCFLTSSVFEEKGIPMAERIEALQEKFNDLREEALRIKNAAKLIQAETSYKVMDQFNGVRNLQTIAKIEALREMRECDQRLAELHETKASVAASLSASREALKKTRSEKRRVELERDVEAGELATQRLKQLYDARLEELGVPQDLVR